MYAYCTCNAPKYVMQMQMKKHHLDESKVRMKCSRLQTESEFKLRSQMTSSDAETDFKLIISYY